MTVKRKVKRVKSKNVNFNTISVFYFSRQQQSNNIYQVFVYKFIETKLLRRYGRGKQKNLTQSNFQTLK